MKYFIKVAKSEKTGKMYACLVCDLGYRMVNISFDTNLCAELLGVSIKDLLSEIKTYILFERSVN